jgi:ubiquinone/menaquinone biosynthesis C-methylase UbiE
MSETYDQTTALHYAAYRPQLHEPILRNCLGTQQFKNGLDIGCGTGVSSRALKTFCYHVIGVDPNKKMLSETVTEDAISYQLMIKDKLPFPDNSFDICTYAGAWWYGKCQALLDETIRVCTTNGTILLYDFEVDFSNIYTILGLVPANLNGYDHRSNFEGLDTSAIRSTSKKTEEKQVLLSPTELAHLLCSENQTYNQVVLKLSDKNTFNRLVEHIKDYLNPSNITVSVLVYHTLYRL